MCLSCWCVDVLLEILCLCLVLWWCLWGLAVLAFWVGCGIGLVSIWDRSGVDLVSVCGPLASFARQVQRPPLLHAAAIDFALVLLFSTHAPDMNNSLTSCLIILWLATRAALSKMLTISR